MIIKSLKFKLMKKHDKKIVLKIIKNIDIHKLLLNIFHL